MTSNGQPIISIKDLKVHFPVAGTGLFPSSTQLVRAVDGVTFDIQPGETMGLVG